MKYLLALALVLISSTAVAVPMANRHYQTAVFACNGTQYNDSIVLDYGQTTQIHAVNIIRDQVSGTNQGHMNVSQDFSPWTDSFGYYLFTMNLKRGGSSHQILFKYRQHKLSR